MKKSKRNTGLMDIHRKYIYEGDKIIVGDNPKTHDVLVVVWDEDTRMYRANKKLPNGFTMSYKLESVHEQCFINS